MIGSLQKEKKRWPMPFSSLTSCLALCNSTWHSSEIDYAHILIWSDQLQWLRRSPNTTHPYPVLSSGKNTFFYHFLHCFELGKDDVYFEIALWVRAIFMCFVHTHRGVQWVSINKGSENGPADLLRMPLPVKTSQQLCKLFSSCQTHCHWNASA